MLVGMAVYTKENKRGGGGRQPSEREFEEARRMRWARFQGGEHVLVDGGVDEGKRESYEQIMKGLRKGKDKAA